MDRVFLDANVLFSAAYRDQSALLQLWAIPDAALLTSHYAIEEARRNLGQFDEQARLVQLTSGMEIVQDDVVGIEIVDVELPAKD